MKMPAKLYVPQSWSHLAKLEIKVLKTSVALCAATISCQGATQAIVTLTAKEPRAASGREIRYTGACGEDAYGMELSREHKKLNLSLNGNITIPLTDAELGRAILNRPLVGDFSFHCLDGTLEIRFFGF